MDDQIDALFTPQNPARENSHRVLSAQDSAHAFCALIREKRLPDSCFRRGEVPRIIWRTLESDVLELSRQPLAPMAECSERRTR